VNGWLEANDAYANITKEQLHLRYGHPGKRAQRKIDGDAEGTSPDQCAARVMAQHPRAEFKPTLDRAEDVFELLHTNMIGPVEVPSLGGALYITTLLDDETGMPLLVPVSDMHLLTA
jgi:hypothetical protein